MRSSLLPVMLAVLCMLGLTGPVFSQTAAQTAAAPTQTQADRIAALEKQVADNTAATAAAQTAGDNSWMLVSAALVLMMSAPGLALFYGGLVRKKNILGTMMQTFAMMAVITVLWAVVTYSLAFGTGNAFIGGLHNVFLRGVGVQLAKDYAPTIPLQTFMVYQLMFAIITPALITGAFAERVKFSAMVAFMVLWAIAVYSPMAHMVWGIGGLLNASLGGKFPCLDFAGGTVVHVTSGVSALVTALYLGKRVGYPKGAHAAALRGLQLHRRGAALGGLVRLQRGLRARRRYARHLRLRRHPLRRRRRGLRLVRRRVDPQRQALRARRHLGRRRRPGRHHARRRLRHAHVRPCGSASSSASSASSWWSPSKTSSATTIRSMPSASTARAAPWAPSSPASSPTPPSTPSSAQARRPAASKGNPHQLFNQLTGIAIAWALSICRHTRHTRAGR